MRYINLRLTYLLTYLFTYLLNANDRQTHLIALPRALAVVINYLQSLQSLHRRRRMDIILQHF